MSIEFYCPHCQKLLRVPDTSAGKKARCPECQKLTDIPMGEQAFDAGSPSPASNTLMGGEAKGSDPDPVNPYASPNPEGSYPLPKGDPTGEIIPTPVEPGEIIEYAKGVWRDNLGLLVGVTAVVGVASWAASGIQRFIQFAIIEGGDDGAVLFGSAIIMMVHVVSSLVQIFLGIGHAQIVLRLVRRQPAEFNQLFGGGPLFGNMLAASILAGIAVSLGFMACIVPGVILMLLYWPFYFLIADEKASAIDSFGLANPIAKENIGTTFVLWLASAGIAIVGLLLCGVGLLFAAPLINVIWGTAYLMMSGQLQHRPAY